MLSAKSVSLDAIVDSLLSQVERDREVSEDTLLGLSVVLPSELPKALEVIDEGKVTLVTAQPSGRSVFQVKGAKNSIYFCFEHYCSCQSFSYNCLQNRTVMCKHQLAARIGRALGNINTRQVDDFDYARLLMDKDKAI